jgi:ribosome maturation factor RimP
VEFLGGVGGAHAFRLRRSRFERRCRDMTVADRVRVLVAPLLDDLGLEIYDIEYAGGVLRLSVDKPGGVDLDAIALATRVVSRELDHEDPIPGRYTLEVTSPGVERSLRTPDHFQRVVGQVVNVRTHPHAEGDRRARGELVAVDTGGITVRADDGSERIIRFDDIERARTVFEWGPGAGPAKPRPQRKAHSS